MKKFIALAILAMSAVAFVPSVEAKSSSTAAAVATSSSAPQIRVQLGQNRRYNQRRVVTQTRRVRVGRQVYRETYRITYRANGTTRTQLISRVRVR